jgi:CheY-like chemotaxis protein
VSVAADPRTVLIAEDEILVLCLLADALEEEGFRVVSAENGAEALQALETIEREGGHVDVLFTDVNMPGIDGLELARRVRALKPDLPIIYASGRVGGLERRDCVEGGRFLPKPYVPSQACAEVASALAC